MVSEIQPGQTFCWLWVKKIPPQTLKGLGVKMFFIMCELDKGEKVKFVAVKHFPMLIDYNCHK